MHLTVSRELARPDRFELPTFWFLEGSVRRAHVRRSSFGVVGGRSVGCLGGLGQRAVGNETAKRELERGGMQHSKTSDRTHLGRLESESSRQTPRQFLRGAAGELQLQRTNAKEECHTSSCSAAANLRCGYVLPARQFVRQLSNSVGYKLHSEVVSKERLVQASILSAKGDVDMRVRLMDEITDTERIQPLVKVIDHLERNDFKWNDVYVATTTPGQQYAGTFAGTDGSSFFFRTEQNHLLVGQLRDLRQTPRPGAKINFTAQ